MFRMFGNKDDASPYKEPCKCRTMMPPGTKSAVLTLSITTINQFQSYLMKSYYDTIRFMKQAIISREYEEANTDNDTMGTQ